MRDIVITIGSAQGSALALARSIKKEITCKAYALCTDLRTSKIIETSKAIDEVLFIKDKSEIGYIEKIKKWYVTKRFKEKPILYFTYDTACFYIDKHRDWFEEHFVLCMPSSKIIQNFTQKGVAEQSAENVGLIVPKTTIIEKDEDIDIIAESFSFPVVVKPRATYLKQNIGFKIKILCNKEEFITFIPTIIRSDTSLVCQEYVPGSDEDVYYYLFYRGLDGKIYDNVGRKLLQSPPGGGIMAKGIVKYNEPLILLSRNFLEKIDYVGIGGIEYKKYNGIFYFIEMSTRLEGFFKIAEISNSPLSLASYYDNVHDGEKLIELADKTQEDGFIYVDFIPTVSAYLKSKRYFKLCRDILSIFFNRKVKLNIYSKNDTKPFWLSLKSIFK